MNKQASEPKGAKVVVEGLDLIRQPFPAHQISKLPKPTKAQTDAVRNDFKAGVRCDICGGWHHPKVVHLDYVGHAALTDRLLDCDPEWNWEPVAFDDHGMPAIVNGGMWIKLTVCGVTRLGYGDAAGKQGGDAVKEIIGDALRNAAMRFGAALDLWHKGDLHGDDDPQGEDHTKPDAKPKGPEPEPIAAITDQQFILLQDLIDEAGVEEDTILKFYGATSLSSFPAAQFDRAVTKLNATVAAKKPKDVPDEIKY